MTLQQTSLEGGHQHVSLKGSSQPQTPVSESTNHITSYVIRELGELKKSYREGVLLRTDNENEKKKTCILQKVFVAE